MLPTTLEINGVVYDIDPSFENCSQIMFAFEDPNIADHLKPIILFNRIFVKEEPELTQESYDIVIDFLDGPKDAQAYILPKKDSKKPRTFLFSQDFKYIIASISSSHGINLREKPQTHWWVFLDMFSDLNPESIFSSIVSLRYKYSKDTLSKEEKKVWKEMSDILILRTSENVEALAEEAKTLEYLNYLESLSEGGK